MKEQEKAVFKTYEQLASAVQSEGYRHNPYYLARKAIVDWDLMVSAGVGGKRILNVGCFEPIDELLWAGLAGEWVAVDLSPQSIAMAKEVISRNLAPSVAEKVKFRIMDAAKLSFQDGEFDLAVSFSVLDHIPDPQVRTSAIREMARVVRPGGFVVITVPNKYSYYRLLYSRNVRRGVSLDVGYQYFYSRRELRRELQNAGLIPERFASDMKPVGDVPRILRGLLLPLMAFGDRMGFLARKP